MYIRVSWDLAIVVKGCVSGWALRFFEAVVWISLPVKLSLLLRVCVSFLGILEVVSSSNRRYWNNKSLDSVAYSAFLSSCFSW